MTRRLWRIRWGVVAMSLALCGLLVGSLWLATPRRVVRIATGSMRSESHRLLAACARVVAETQPRSVWKILPQANLTASAEVLEAGAVDLAVVRSDSPLNAKMRTIAILRRDVVALLVPPRSPITTVGALARKTLGVVQGPAGNAHLLDQLLLHYHVPLATLPRVELTPADVGEALSRKRVAAIAVVGPIGAGPLAETVAVATRALKGAPSFLSIDAAEIIAQLTPGVEDSEIAAGAFGGTPPIPDDVVPTLAVTLRLVAPARLSDYAAGEIARLLFVARAQLLKDFPQASAIEAPDMDPGAVLPVHPGAAAYFSGEHTGLWEGLWARFEGFIYLGAILISLTGSIWAWLMKTWRHKGDAQDAQQMQRLLTMLRAVPTVDRAGLEALEQEVHAMVAWAVERVMAETITAERFQTLTQVITQLRQALDRRRLHLERSRDARLPGLLPQPPDDAKD